MTEIAKRRRRWPWVSLAIFVLLLSGPPLWQLRPLNSEEARLVGEWKLADIYDAEWEATLRFDPNRRYTQTYVNGSTTEITYGSWALSSGIFYLRDDDRPPIGPVTWKASFAAIARRFMKPWSELSFRAEGLDRCWINGPEYRRIDERP